jgi:hypothetical protein
MAEWGVKNDAAVSTWWPGIELSTSVFEDEGPVPPGAAGMVLRVVYEEAGSASARLAR